MRILSLIVFSVILASCSGSDTANDGAASSTPGFSLTATSSISTPEAIAQTTFVPNNVATWASAIILRGESGSLWRTTTEEYPPALISKGPYVDIYGLARENAAGVFLALTPEGGLKAFAEIDDEGNYDKAPISYGGPDIAKFCTGAPDDGIWVLGIDKNLHKLSAAFSQSNVVEISAIDELSAAGTITDCASDPSGGVYAKLQNKNKIKWSLAADAKWTPLAKLSGVTSLSFLAPNAALAKGADPADHFIYDGKSLRPFTIEGGLSISGLSSSRAVAATPLPMGSTYNNGLIAFGDLDENRLVLISGSYALHRLQKAED